MRPHDLTLRALLTPPILCMAAACTSTQAPEPVQQPAQPFEVAVPGCTQSVRLMPIPAAEGVGAFWMASTEVTWDMYDAFVFAMDRAEGEADPVDAYTRPSKPYILMDRGFGHKNYPVISVSTKGAAEYCKWLSAKTGYRFRLPTEAEWMHAARAGQAGEWGFAGGQEKLTDHAWYFANAMDEEDFRLETRSVGLKAANAYGLHDMHGNACEWTLAADGSFVAKGGSFKEKPEALMISARRANDAALNATDPQIPKSVWWLADGGFVGFRVVCDGH
jgi:formylglycine-generating enzyme required for sulfatase activity